jgi:hypothetical protein
MSTLFMIPDGPRAAILAVLCVVFLFRFRLPVALFLMLFAGIIIFG